MPLTNAQYDSIMRDYSRTRAAHQQEAEKTRARIIAACPGLDGLLKDIQADSAGLARLRLSGDTDGAARLEDALAQKRKQRDRLLSSHGFSAADLEVKYSCPDCRDTGYIGSQKCHCLRQASINLLYEQSRLKTVLEKENFDHFSLDLYSREPMKELDGKSNYEYMAGVLKECRDYAASFHRGSQSLLFTGETGVGKTFLANCIAREVLNAGYSVLSLSAIEFFDLLAHQIFDGYDQGYEEQSELLSCDLLIVDDLGTEVTNSFTLSRLFHCINTRLLDSRPMIISTNYSLNDLGRVYAERIASRLFSSYRIYRLYGQDIRIMRRLFP